MGLIAQEVRPDALYLRDSSGADLLITKDQVVAYFQTLNGPVPQKRAETLAHFTAVIETWLGVDPGQVTIDFDWTGANTWKTLTIRWSPE